MDKHKCELDNTASAGDFIWLTTTPRHCNMLSIVSPSKIIQSVSGYGANSRGSVLVWDSSVRHRIHTDLGDGVIQRVPEYL